ncbi:bacteriohemerythrin [Desulfobacterales bacterium HSG16]|nr:bacteriohemerythrin [Desulfobacterales bacterium HSG16]
MALIEWKSSYSVNVAEIDRQHQKLIKILNILDDAMRQGKGKDVLGKIVNSLIDYAQIHFSTEEMYFVKLEYPDSAAHIKEHKDFVKKVFKFKNDFNQGKLGLSIDIMNFLSGWLTNHIQVSDKKYEPFFNSKGLK